MEQLFVFYINGVLDCVCEEAYSATNFERYIRRYHNNVELRTVIARDLDKAWAVIDDASFDCIKQKMH